MEFYGIVQQLAAELNLTAPAIENGQYFVFTIDGIRVDLLYSDNHLILSGLSESVNVGDVATLSQFLSENLIGHNKLGINFGLTEQNQLQVSIKKKWVTIRYDQVVEAITALVTYVRHWKKIFDSDTYSPC